MATQLQAQQPDKLPQQRERRKWLSRRNFVILTVILIALIITTIWILSTLGTFPKTWATISSIIVTILGAIFAFLQSSHLFIQPDKHQQQALSIPQTPPIIIQVPTTQPLPPPPLSNNNFRGIVGLPPPTDRRTIQQRENLVKDIYNRLTQPGLTALALTGIGGAGKSTLAALVYRYTEEQRLTVNTPFQSEAIWLAVDPVVTLADLAGNLFEALGKPLPDLSNLASQNQALALFNALNTTDKPRLIILDQFENLLDWETGRALTDRPGVGEWLDIINSQQCRCRILLTSRPRPTGTREFPPTYLQEYPIKGLEITEGIDLLQKQGVNGTEEELGTAVAHCNGHAFSLILLASLIRNHNMSLTTLFKDPTLWIGDIASNLLEYIYTKQFHPIQQQLLLAFSVYREPAPLEAAQALMTDVSKVQISSALKALRTQHLLEAVGEGRYQLHAIVVEFVKGRFVEDDEQANQEASRVAHAKAAQYYLQQAAKTCPPHEKRRRINDVHDLIEAIWQMCQAEQWKEAHSLMEQEGLFADLSRWGGNATLLDLYRLLERIG